MSDHDWDEADDEHPESDLGAFDYLSDPAPQGASWSDLDSLGGYETSSTTTEYEPADDAHEEAAAPGSLDDEDAGADESTGPIDFDVTSPAGTVTAHATLTGRIHRIELSSDAVSMTESELVRDILTTAKLANIKGRAVQRAMLQGILMQQGMDRHDASNFLDETNDLPTPREAEEAQAEVLADYLRDHH